MKKNKPWFVIRTCTIWILPVLCLGLHITCLADVYWNDTTNKIVGSFRPYTTGPGQPIDVPGPQCNIYAYPYGIVGRVFKSSYFPCPDYKTQGVDAVVNHVDSVVSGIDMTPAIGDHGSPQIYINAFAADRSIIRIYGLYREGGVPTPAKCSLSALQDIRMGNVELADMTQTRGQGSVRVTCDKKTAVVMRLPTNGVRMKGGDHEIVMDLSFENGKTTYKPTAKKGDNDYDVTGYLRYNPEARGAYSGAGVVTFEVP